MADNTIQNATDTIATDDLATINGGASGSVKVQRVKVGYGSDSDFRDADPTHGIPIQATQSSTGTITGPTSTGTTSFTVLASNVLRRQAVFYNGTNVDILLALNATSSTTAYTMRLLVGGYYELPGDSVIYVGVVSGLPVAPSSLTATGSTSGTLTVTELT